MNLDETRALWLTAPLMSRLIRMTSVEKKKDMGWLLALGQNVLVWAKFNCLKRYIYIYIICIL